MSGTSGLMLSGLQSGLASTPRMAVGYPVNTPHPISQAEVVASNSTASAAGSYGLSSIEPKDAGDELDGGKEVARRLLVACDDRTMLLDLGEEVLDRMTRAMKLSIVVARR